MQITPSGSRKTDETESDIEEERKGCCGRRIVCTAEVHATDDGVDQRRVAKKRTVSASRENRGRKRTGVRAAKKSSGRKKGSQKKGARTSKREGGRSDSEVGRARRQRPKARATVVPSCGDETASQRDIELGLYAVLECIRDCGRIRDYITDDDLAMFLHCGAEMFLKEPMLLELDFHKGVIVGDLHGSFIDLLIAFNDASLPPQIEYLFLGDYVDKGPHQIEVFLFILLLKLRWPDRVHMLRGNHENYDMNLEFDFVCVCENAYPDSLVYPLFSDVFDVMPVAAILGDSVLCCHGGVSQWMTSRDCVRNMRRPLSVNSMTLLENCLLNDILWSDPDPRQRSPFVPSERRTSYTFNKEGLLEVLRAMKCRTLIRGHMPFMEGTHEDIPKYCYTVHSVPADAHPDAYAAIFIVRKDPKRPHVFYFESQTHAFNPSDERALLKVQCDLLRGSLSDALGASKYRVDLQPFRNEECAFCAVEPCQSLAESMRFVAHEDIARWVFAEAARLVSENASFSESRRQLSYDAIVFFAAAVFPLFFDVVTLKGETYRVGLRDHERVYIQAHHPDVDFKATPVSMTESRVVLKAEPRPVSHPPRTGQIEGFFEKCTKAMMKMSGKSKIYSRDATRKAKLFRKFVEILSHPAQHPEVTSSRMGTETMSAFSWTEDAFAGPSREGRERLARPPFERTAVSRLHRPGGEKALRLR